MKNHRILASCALLFLLSGAGVAPAFAQFVTEKTPAERDSPPAQAPSLSPPAAAVSTGGPMTVTDVIIDKTDKNAVLARDEAIVEAQRKAFEVLAEKSMSPEDFKAYKMPDNKTIETLVDNFEIKNEQLSATRYVANFTVRFLPDINSYLKIPDSLGRIVDAAPSAASAATAATAATPEASAEKTDSTASSATSAPATAGTTPAPASEKPAASAASAAPRSVLVLPYYEGASGKKILWEDPNPWRDSWQETGGVTPSPNLTISAPLGDLTDVNTGSTDAVWKKDYTTLEKERANYNATEVALAVAHAGKDIDLYLYKDGKLEHLKPISGKYDAASYKKAIAKVIAEIKKPEPLETAAPTASTEAADTAAPPPPPGKTAEKPATQAEEGAVGGKVIIEATMNFGNYSQWMEAQKRLAEISPPVDIEISSLTRDQAQFTIDYDGGMASFKTALAEKGLELGRPTVEVDESVLGSDRPTRKTIYELKLLN